MPPLTRLFLLLGALSALTAVLLGAFGAHVLRRSVTAEMMTVYQTAVQYHFYHALGLLAVGALTYQVPQSAYLKWSGWLMVAGIGIFSGSLYALSISGIRWLGAITPFGGTAWIVAWLLLMIAVVKAS